MMGAVAALEGVWGTHRFLDTPHKCGSTQLKRGVRKEADVAAAMVALCAQLRAILGGVQIALINSMCVGALHSLQHGLQACLSFM